MSTRLNARSDAKLKRLDDLIIVEIVRRRTTTGVKDADILAWLQAEHGVSSSPAALSESFPYLEARARSWQREQRIAAWMDDDKAQHPELSDEQLFTRGQRRMELLTIADEDPDAWVKLQSLRHEKEKFRASLKTKIETALAALAAEVKGNAPAEAALQNVFTALEK